MTARSLDFLPFERQLFPRDIAAAVAEFLRQRGLTAKDASRRYGLDLATVQNIPKGVCALGTLLKIALVEGRDFWTRVGDEIYGETLEQYEERRLTQIIEEAADAQARLVQLRERREALATRSVDAVAAFDRSLADERRVRRFERG